MKKIICILVCSIFAYPVLGISYDLSPQDKKVVADFVVRLKNVYDEQPWKVEIVLSNIERVKSDFVNDQRTYAVMSFLEKFTNLYKERFILEDKEDLPTELEDDKKQEEDKKEEKEDYLEEKEETIEEKDVVFDEFDFEKYDEKILSIDLESKIDNWLLTDLYIFNNWDDLDLDYLVQDIALVHEDQKIAYWYVLEDKFIHFQVSGQGLYLPRRDLVNVEVYLNLNEPKQSNHVGKLEFWLWESPIDKVDWTSSWARVLSEWSGRPMNVEIDFRSTFKKFVLKSSFLVEDKKDFSPSFRQAYKFDLFAGNSRLIFDKFRFDMSWSFVNYIDDNVEFVLYYQGDKFWKSTGDEIVYDRYIDITHTWDSINYVSANSVWDFILEIQNQSNMQWSRDIRLYDIAIQDWFGNIIDWFYNYANTGLPWKWINYRY